MKKHFRKVALAVVALQLCVLTMPLIAVETKASPKDINVESNVNNVNTDSGQKNNEQADQVDTSKPEKEVDEAKMPDAENKNEEKTVKSTEKTAEKEAQKVTEKATEKAAEKATEKATEKAAEKATEKAAENKTSKAKEETKKEETKETTKTNTKESEILKEKSINATTAANNESVKEERSEQKESENINNDKKEESKENNLTEKSDNREENEENEENEEETEKFALKILSQEEYEEEYKATKLRIEELKKEIESLEYFLKEIELEAVQENSMDMDISARIENQMEPDYIIVIPSKINAGELSRDMDTTIPYSMTVDMKEGESGYIEISTEENGKLVHDEKREVFINFLNRFGTRKVQKTETESSVVLSSEIFIKAQDVQAADPGEYTGVMRFDIKHYAEGAPDTPDGNNKNPGAEGNKGNQKEDKNDQNNTGKEESKPETKKLDKETKEKKGRMTARVSLRKESDFEELSMADKLFFNRADLNVGEKETEVTLYVIDPIPKYPEEGTPIKNVKFLYENESYKANVKTANETKEFEMADGFIEAEGKYPVSKVTVKLPNDAIWNSAEGVLKCETYVNAVMKSTQTFYVVFDDFEGGKTKKETEKTIKLEDNQYIVDVSIMEEKSKKKQSKYNALFSDKADVSVSGEEAVLTLYFIDPVPKYKDEDSVFSNTVFLYEGSEYEASIDNGESLVRKYNKAEGYIDQSGNYKSSAMKVTLSKEAINDANNGKLHLKFHVKAGNDKDETVTVYLKNFTLGSTKNSARTPDGEKTEEKKAEDQKTSAVPNTGASTGRRGGQSGATGRRSGARNKPPGETVQESVAPTEVAEMQTQTNQATTKDGASQEQVKPVMLSAKSGVIAEVLKFTLLILGSGIGYGVKRKFF